MDRTSVGRRYASTVLALLLPSQYLFHEGPWKVIPAITAALGLGAGIWFLLAGRKDFGQCAVFPARQRN